MMYAFHDWDPPTNRQSEVTDSMRDWQGSRCAICGAHEVLVLDHDHATGLTRGYLCRGCNVMEGMGHDDIFDAWRHGDNPATAHGWAAQYVSPWPSAPSRDAEIGFHLALIAFMETKSWRSGVMLADAAIRYMGRPRADGAIRSLVHYAHMCGADSAEISELMAIPEDEVRSIEAAMVASGARLPHAILAPPEMTELSRVMLDSVSDDERALLEDSHRENVRAHALAVMGA